MAPEVWTRLAALQPAVEERVPHEPPESYLPQLWFHTLREALRVPAGEREALGSQEAVWRAAIDSAARVDSNNPVLLYLELAERQRLAGDLAASRATLERSLEEHPEAAGYRPEVLLSLAALRFHQGDAQAALQLLERAEAEVHGPEQPYFAAHLHPHVRIVGLRGRVYVTLGLADLGWACIEEERRLRELLDDPMQRAVLESVALTNLGEFAMGTDKPELALEPLEAAVAEPKVPIYTMILRAYLAVALSDLSRRDPSLAERAEEMLKLVQEADDPSFLPVDDGLLLAVILRRADLALRRGDTVLARRCLDAASEKLERSPNPDSRAFALALRSRLARMEGVAPTERVRAELEAAFVAILDLWRKMEVREGGLGFLDADYRRYLWSELLRVSMDLDGVEAGAEHALDTLLQAQALGSTARALGIEPGTLAAHRAELPDQAGILLLFPSLYGSHAVAIDSTAIVHALIPNQADLRRWVSEYVSWVRKPPSSGREGDLRARELAELEATLGRALFPAAVAARLDGWREVTLMSVGILRTLPAEALPVAGGKRLGTGWAVSNAPSIPLAAFLNQRAHRASSFETDLLLIAAPDHDPELEERWPSLRELPFGEDDQATVTRGHAESRVEVRRGGAARLSALESQTRAASWHILAHGVYDSTQELGASLVLAPLGPGDNGLASAGQLRDLHAAPVVVLSACEAARGPDRFGDDGVSHLGGAFILAGSTSVVLSPFHNSYRATIELTGHLHQELAAGASPAEALRRARVALSSQPGTSDPYYSSLVRVIGAGHVPLFPGRSAPDDARVSTTLVVLTLASVGLALLILLGRSRRGRPGC